MIPISTSFGEIRQWRREDENALARYADNRKIWLNMRDAFPHPYKSSDAQNFLKMVEKQNPTTFFAIANQDEAIGGIGISINQDVHRLTAEMGYWLAEPFWGKGIMSETVSKFTEYAFAEFNLVRIFAEPFSSNSSSCRVLEKAGFMLEGRLHCSVIKDGQILDQLLYAKFKK